MTVLHMRWLTTTCQPCNVVSDGIVDAGQSPRLTAGAPVVSGDDSHRHDRLHPPVAVELLTFYGDGGRHAGA